MAKKKLSPLVAAMQIFNGLDERDQITLADYIRSQTPRKVKDPKSPAPSAKPRSSRKPGATESTVNSETETEGVSSVAVCAVPDCGLGLDNFIHTESLRDGYHAFSTEIKKRGKPVILPDNPKEFQHGASA